MMRAQRPTAIARRRCIDKRGDIIVKKFKLNNRAGVAFDHPASLRQRRDSQGPVARSASGQGCSWQLDGRAFLCSFFRRRLALNRVTALLP